MSEQESKIRILLVDDEADFRDSAKFALERRGIEVETASDGINALKTLKERNYDAVLLDIKMPGIDGSVVAHILRKDQPDLPIIILTGHGSIPQAFEATKSGVYDYIAKPCNMDQLAERLKEAVLAHPIEENEKKFRERTLLQGPAAVLLVDDEEEFLASLKPVLERRKMIVLIAKDGQEAIELLQKVNVDVVLLDVRMPKLDGIDVLTKIKSAKPQIEVILLTGHPKVEIAKQAIRNGAFDYLIKPPDIDELIKTIKRAFLAKNDVLEDKQQASVENILKKHPD